MLTPSPARAKHSICDKQSIDFRGKRVVDLGCGHGLPGLHALLRGASHVVFQDLNEEVLVNCTTPNLALNTPLSKEVLSSEQPPAALLAGNWNDERLTDMMLCSPASPTPEARRVPYDYILTSDTLYSLDSLPVLLQLLKTLTAKPHGVAFVAAKRYYFGVGGSTQALMDLVNADAERGGGMVGKTVHVWEDGQSNIRELLALTWQ